MLLHTLLCQLSGKDDLSVSAWMDIDFLITLKMTAVTKHQFAEWNAMYLLPISPFPHFPYLFLVPTFRVTPGDHFVHQFRGQARALWLIHSCEWSPFHWYHIDIPLYCMSIPCTMWIDVACIYNSYSSEPSLRLVQAHTIQLQLAITLTNLFSVSNIYLHSFPDSTSSVVRAQNICGQARIKSHAKTW